MFSALEEQGVNATSCGYCRSPEGHTSVSHGVWAHRLTCEDYQALVDRGWRRSGCFLYRGDNAASCCTTFAVRLPVAQFTPSREHRRLQRRLAAFCAGQVELSDLAPAAAAAAAAAGPSPCAASATPPRCDVAQTPRCGDDDAYGDNVARGAPTTGHSGGGGPYGCSPPGTPPTSVSAPHEHALRDALAGAVARCVADGVLPQELQLPPIRVTSLPRRLASRLQPGAVSTSAVAHALAAGLARLEEQRQEQHQHQQTHTRRRDSHAEEDGHPVASTLLPPPPPQQQQQQQQQLPRHVVDACRLADTLARTLTTHGLPLGVRVDSVAGHLNFIVDARSGNGGTTAVASSSADGACSEQDHVMAPSSPEVSVPLCAHARGASRRRRRSHDAGAYRGGGGGGGGTHIRHAPAPPEGTTTPAMLPPLVAPPRSRQLVVHTRPSGFDAAEFALYRKYQAIVHGERPRRLTAASYTHFLVHSPLVAVPPGPGTPSCGYGTVHRQYWLGDVLVGVGVCDVLPSGVSSVYMFYDPDYAPLCLGKASACEEIAWVAAQQRSHSPGLRFYHLGLYIPSCPKMRYKAAFKPSQVLCPRTLTWVPLAEASAAMDAGAKWLCDPTHDDTAPQAACQKEDVDPLLLFPDAGAMVRFSALRASGALPQAAAEQLGTNVRHWAAGVGPDVARRAACVCWHAGGGSPETPAAASS